MSTPDDLSPENGADEDTNPAGLTAIAWDPDRDTREGQIMAEVVRVRADTSRIKGISSRIALEQRQQHNTLEQHSKTLLAHTQSLQRIEDEGKNRDRKLYKMLSDATRKGAAQGAVGTGGVLVIAELILELLKRLPW